MLDWSTHRRVVCMQATATPTVVIDQVKHELQLFALAAFDKLGHTHCQFLEIDAICKATQRCQSVVRC